MATSIEDLYQQYAGRASDPEGLAYWTKDFGDTIDPNEIAIFQNAVTEARAKGTEPAAQTSTANTTGALAQAVSSTPTAQEIANTSGMGALGIGIGSTPVTGATREQVLAAYAANPKAELSPSEEAINYWMQSGVGDFNTVVDQVRAQNPDLAASIDAARGSTTGGVGQVTTDAGTTGNAGALSQVAGTTTGTGATGTTATTDTTDATTGTAGATTGAAGLNNTHVIALGDSTTFGYNAGNRLDTNMVSSAQTALGGNYTIDNFGVNSTTVGDLLTGENGTGSNWANTLSSDAGVVVLNYGMNEAYRGEDPATFAANLTKAVNDLKAAGKTVILQTPNIATGYDWAGNVSAYADVVRNVANATGSALDDKYAATSGMTNFFDATTGDTIHPGSDAYAALGVNLANVISGLNNSSATTATTDAAATTDNTATTATTATTGALDQAVATTDAVADLYQQVLGRAPDAEGLDYWSKQFGPEISPEERAEFERAADPELRSRVEGLYRDMLGRDADQEGIEYWTKQFGSDITDAEREQFRQSAAAELTGAFGGETPDDAGLLAGFKRAKDLGISDDVLKNTLGEDLFNTYEQGLTNFAVTNLTNIVADNQLTWDESQKIHNFGRDLGFTPEDLARLTGQDKTLFELADNTYKAGRDQIINGSLTAPTVTSDADRVLTGLALQDKYGFTDEELSAATGVDVNTIKSSLDPVRNFSTTFSSTVNSPDTTTAQLKTLIADSRGNAAINKMYGESLNGIETKLNGLEQKWSSQQGVDPLQAENLFQQLEAQKNALGGQYYSGVFGDTMNMAAALNRKGLETIDDLGQKDKFASEQAHKIFVGPNGRFAYQDDIGNFFQYDDVGGAVSLRPEQVTTTYNKYIPDEYGGGYLPLSAEELATLKDDGTYQNKIGTVVIDKDTGAELTNTDGVLAMQRSGGKLTSKKHYINVGFTEDGRPILTASQEKSGLYGAVSDLAPMVLTVASFIPGPHQPFARLANAALALEQDNYLGAVLSGLSAFSSFTGNELATLRAADAAGQTVDGVRVYELQNTLANVKLATTFVQGAAALQAENLPALINAGLSAYTQMSDTPLPSGVTTAVQLGNLGIAIENKQYDQALNALGDLTGSQDVKIAGSAKTLIDEFSKAQDTGDFSGVINAGLGLVDAVNARPTTQVDQGGITNRIVDDNISTVSQGEGDAGAAAFAAAKSAGASDEDAMAAANAVTGVQINKIPDAGPSNVVTTSYLPAEEVKTERTRLAEEFAASRGKTIDKLTAEEVDNFVDKVDSAIASRGSAVLKGASIQDILSGSYASRPTDEKGFYYDERGVPIIDVVGYNKLDAIGNVINMEPTDTGSKIATNVADAIVENITGLEGTTGKIVQQGLSTLLGGLGEQVADISTSFGNIGLISRDNAGVTAGKYLEDIGKRLQLPETKQAIENWVGAVDKEPTYFGKIAAGVKGVIQNPLVLTEVVKEVGQEILPGAIGLKIAKYAGLGAGVASSTVLNALESAGSTGRQTYDEEIAKGTPPAEAARIADRKAGYAGIITLATSGITDAAIAKKYGAAIEDFLGKKASSTGGEFAQEGLEEGLIALATGKTPAEALTQSVVGSLVGAKTSGTIQTAADVQSDLAASFASQGLMSTDGSFKADTIVPISTTATAGAGSVSTEGAGSSLDLASNVTTQLGSGADAAVVIGDTITGAVDSGADIGNVINSTVTSGLNAGASADVVINSAITSGITGGADASVVIGNTVTSAINSGANVKATVESSVSSALAAGADASIAVGSSVTSVVNSGGNVTTAVNSAVTSAVNAGSNVTVAVESAVTAAVTAGASVDTTLAAAVSSAVNSGANVATVVNAATAAATATGNNVSIASDANVVTISNATTNTTTTVDTATGVTTSVDSTNNVTTVVDGNTTTSVDANANTTTQTTVDANNNTQTTVVADANTNTNTQTTVNNNTNVTTSTTVDANSTTQTTIDANNNTQTTVLTNSDTNTQTTVKVNIDTGDVIEVKETEIPADWKQPVIEVPKTPEVPVATPPGTPAKPTVPEVPKLNPLEEQRRPSGGAGQPTTINIGGDPLRSRVTEGAIDPLARVKQAQAELEREVMMNQIDPRLLSVIQQRTNPNQQAEQLDADVGALAKLLRGDSDAPANEGRYYSYGSEDSIDDILGGKAANYAAGGYVEPLKATGGAMALPLMAKSGGALGKYKGREDFKDGKHVAGDGDGQSDDIPAWLADGEFVFPADVVSALGNGSTKAGTDKLYEMMHSIRDRARSKGPKDLPPPALKSPLDYLKSSKRSAK